jgi:hypothetical protein
MEICPEVFMKHLTLFALLFSLSAYAYDTTPYQESQEITQNLDVFARVGKCVTVGEGINVPMITTSLTAGAKRISVNLHQSRTCHKTGWFSHSCTRWSTVGKDKPKVSFVTKVVFNESRAKMPGNNPYGAIRDHQIAEELGEKCESVRLHIQDEIRDHRR